MSYNKAFESIVKDETDVIGFIAYGLYKQHKNYKTFKILEKD